MHMVMMQYRMQLSNSRQCGFAHSLLSHSLIARQLFIFSVHMHGVIDISPHHAKSNRSPSMIASHACEPRAIHGPCATCLSELCL